MKIFHNATQGDPTKGCYYTSNYYLKKILEEKKYLTNNSAEADIIYITENRGGLDTFKKYPDKIKVLQLVCSHPTLYCKLMKEECEKFNMWDERPFIWAPTRQKEIDLADYIIVYSDFSKNACIDNGVPKEKVIVIPKGVETDVFMPKNTPRDNIYTILMPGQQFIMKGIQYAMQAYKELKEEGFDFKMVLCGDKTTHMAKDRKSRSFEIGRLIPPDIENHGRVNRTELIKLYNQSDVILGPSVEDSFGMVFLEALSCDKPVICTENTGARELLTHHKNGSIIPIRDVEAIKREIKYWKEHKPKECRKLALSHTMDKYMSDIINFLKIKRRQFTDDDWKIRQRYEISAWGQADIEKIQKQKAKIIKNLSIFPIKDFKDKIIVDVGAGPQGWMEDIKAKERIAIDPLMDKYDAKGWKLKEKNYLHLISEGEKLPILTGYADVVFCFNALSHTRNPLQVIKEIYRILNKDGLFYFYHSVLDETMAFHLHHKLSTYQDIIIQQGFKIIFEKQKEIKKNQYYFMIFQKKRGK